MAIVTKQHYLSADIREEIMARSHQDEPIDHSPHDPSEPAAKAASAPVVPEDHPVRHNAALNAILDMLESIPALAAQHARIEMIRRALTAPPPA